MFPAGERDMHERLQQRAGVQTVTLRDVRWLPRYSTSRNDLIAEFYDVALENASRYDRLVGYFRSSFFSLTGGSVAGFALAGGHIRLVCSPEISENDAAAIQEGLDKREIVDEAVRRELKEVLEHPMAKQTVELLAALVALDCLEIRFALRDEGDGIFHDKVGLFEDSKQNRVSFVGSINESWRAWHPRGNHEFFEVFTSWSDSDRVAEHVSYFEAVWSGNEPGVETIEAATGFRNEILRHAPDDPGEELKIRAEQRDSSPPSSRPRLFGFQAEALRCWKRRGYTGILRHATGAGKTITALEGARGWIDGGGAAVVLVPTIVLQKQWARESEGYLGDVGRDALLVGGGHDEWRRRQLLSTATSPGSGFLTIATLQTAINPAFRQMVTEGDHLLVIADEVHRCGASEYRTVTALDAGARLGLSATPERYGDPDGTAAIRAFFGDDLEPIVTLEDAIEMGRLCPYEYFIHPVALTTDEVDRWNEITEKLPVGHFEENFKDLPEYAKLLLIQRARIAKKAAGKAVETANVIIRDYRPGQKWLAYCEDTEQLRELVDLLRQPHVTALIRDNILEYHSAMAGDADQTLRVFREYGGILAAIRCLDEGVDIPEVSHAVILASSRNPREYIQRRGRVLRISRNKRRAVVHDMFVLPPVGGGGRFGSLIGGEIARSAEFARSAINEAGRAAVLAVAAAYGVDVTDMLEGATESDEDGEEKGEA
jgi:superfamily II DNA or RNA helicase